MEHNYVTKTNKNKKIKRFVCLFLLQISIVFYRISYIFVAMIMETLQDTFIHIHTILYCLH